MECTHALPFRIYYPAGSMLAGYYPGESQWSPDGRGSRLSSYIKKMIYMHVPYVESILTHPNHHNVQH